MALVLLSKETPRRRVKRLLGGSKLDTLERYPHAVRIVEEDGQPVEFTVTGKVNISICSGTIIAPRWVLTAKHCSYRYNASRYHIEMGSSEVKLYPWESETSGPEKLVHVGVKRMICHPNEDVDLMLLLLDQDVNTAEKQFQHIGFPKLPPSDPDFPKVGTACRIVAYGKTQAKEVVYSPTLFAHELTNILVREQNSGHNVDPSGNVWHPPIEMTFLVGGFGNSIYDGDSGAGVFCEYQDDWVLAGVVSGNTEMGNETLQANEPGICMRLSAYTSWLNRVFKWQYLLVNYDIDEIFKTLEDTFSHPLISV